MKNKILTSGLLSGVAILVISLVSSQIFTSVFPSLSVEYQTALFRSWNDPLMTLYFVYPFLLGLILALAWDKTKTLFKGKNEIKRGVNFGLSYALISTLPGMFITLSSFQISTLMVFVWAVSGVLDALVAGLICARVNK